MTYSTHPDYAALLRGVREDPDADLPRLVAADWLDDQGDKAAAARAEFIRLSCELAGKPRVGMSAGECIYCPTVYRTVFKSNLVDYITADRAGVSSATGPTLRCRCGNCRLLRRERDLLARHRIDWDGEVLAVPLADWHRRYLPRRYTGPTLDTDRWLFSRGSLHYSRGFVTRLTLPAAAFAECGPALFGAAPVECVTFPDAGGGGSTRVEINPPGEGYGWQAYYYRDAEADFFDMSGWATRGEVAAGVAAVVAAWPELATP